MIPKFTTPCFIRKNTPELHKKLEELGYIILFSARNGCGDSIHVCDGYASSIKAPKTYANVIDCGSNEQLFLALAALREDSDKKQWFTNGKEWKLCPIENVNQFIEWEMQGFHKATPEELIEHFNKK